MNCGIIGYEGSFLKALTAETLVEGDRAINIGGGAGTSSAAILLGARLLTDFKLYSLDIEEVEDERERIGGAIEAGRAEQIVGKSWEIGENWAGSPLGLVFVDGDHSYDGVVKDLETFAPLIREGGLLVCHDYLDESQKGVTKAIDEFMEENSSDWLELGSVLFTIAYKRLGGDNEWAMNRIELP